MKKTILILAVLTLFFAMAGIYFMYFADSGADGLSTFIPLVLVGVLFVCCFLAFVISLFITQKTSGAKKWLLGIVIALPILGFVRVIGLFGYFTFDYNSQYAVQIQENKSVLETIQFKDENFGVTFQHVSGNVSTYENGIPIPTPITPRIVNKTLIVPSDDETYLDPDRLMKIEGDSNQELSAFLDNLKQKLQIADASFKKIKSKTFSKLPTDTEILIAENQGVSFENRLILGQHFVSELSDAPDLIYFIKTPESLSQIWVLIVSGKVFSAPASVEKMSTSNFEEGNLWFHSLKFID